MTGAALVSAPASAAADGAVIEALLRCWAREHGLRVAGNGCSLTLALAAGTITVPVLAASPTGWHRFGPPHLDGAPIDLGRLVALVADDLTRRHELPACHRADLVARTLHSRDRIADHAAARTGRALPVPPSFLDGEQELVAGHPFHPAAKSREDFSSADVGTYSPELGASFPLRWFAVDSDLVSSGSAVGRRAESLLAEATCLPATPPGTVAVPLHPWQARALLARPPVVALVDQGAVQDLGDGYDVWRPTSSLRTVWRPGAPWMLKLSLAVRITNSRRENLRAELRLGEQAHRLLAAGIGRQLSAAHPNFRVVTDPAWVGVDVPDAGFDTAIRHNPFQRGAPAVCMAALLDARPGCGGPLLAEILRRLAAGSARPLAAVADEWVRRYVTEIVAPLTWLDGAWGIVLEAHHQNTLVTLDADGWPAGGWYRDSQGWYFAASGASRLDQLAPGFDQARGAVFDDELVARRGAYYLGVNNLFGLIGALGAAGIGDEEALLATVRRALLALPRSRVLDVLLRSPRIPCKANLLTCAEGRDELEGPVEHQSVYVDVHNPLAELAS